MEVLMVVVVLRRRWWELRGCGNLVVVVVAEKRMDERGRSEVKRCVQTRKLLLERRHNATSFLRRLTKIRTFVSIVGIYNKSHQVYDALLTLQTLVSHSLHSKRSLRLLKQACTIEHTRV
jgi:hypothetical protein